MRSQPVAAGEVLFLGTANGNVLAIDQSAGCVHWRFAADSTVRSSLNLDTTSDGVATLFFADDLGTVYAVTADEGRLRWKTSLRWFPVSVISGSARLNSVKCCPIMRTSVGTSWCINGSLAPTMCAWRMARRIIRRRT